MKKIYRNFINADEALSILKDRPGNKMNVLNATNPFIIKVVEKLKKDFDFTVKEQSYWNIERKSDGHPWHQDTGTNNHMMWCEVGVSLLLSEYDSGGDTWYADDKDGTNAIKSDRKIYDLVAHTSDEWHKVDPHKGSRYVFLMFI